MKIFSLLAVSALGQFDEDGVYDGEGWMTNGIVEADENDSSPPGRSFGLARTGDRGLPGSRRYADLEQMAKRTWKNAGFKKKDRFDSRKYWAYGCHCYLLGDRPLSEMGKGTPKDGLDSKCKRYKDCQKCAREEFGESCIGEFVQYTWKYSRKQGDFITRDAVGTCENALFQCDKQFVADTLAVKDIFDEQYHAFWGNFDNRDPDNCPSGGGGIPAPHQCCGGDGFPYQWMNENRNKCCNNEVIGISDMCY
ncbi:Oidioi.mRNA.OKI2018_I69.PAR.g9327.t1.cds [Oikopleura dioica]|uniref:Oidioi.mRNA.OKI2018_I69.PAR.g9327.t1.cds n=1 Tax=Oikopleura dioica TaxID=34765 RepID=A0ABN7RK89_OIKDI|nr:Oidioi.mRNA.OKI2018_I69.PAR.g9327.t1.cds [Oikopleura dioica]